jgi:transcriptional regulator with XRE-family HTH domain
MSSERQSFGEFVRQARLKASLTLREAARRMNFSASYLSRVESGDEAPSPKLLASMSKEYNLEIEKLTALASKKSTGAYGHILRDSAELRALYRVGSMLTPEEVENFLRRVLTEKLGLAGESLENEIRKLKSELPRLRKGTEGLFAADVKPRLLSRKQINAMAEAFLHKYGLNLKTYKPPTPIEFLVESEPDIRLRITELDQNPTGKPHVLGMTRWGFNNIKEIFLNSTLAEHRNDTSEYRLLFTLGHELFHAIEHLPLMAANCQPQTECFRTAILNSAVISQDTVKTEVQRAIECWRDTNSQPRKLWTAEDWREWQAQTFSACVLMPEWAVKHEFQNRLQMSKIKCRENQKPHNLAFDIATQNIFGNLRYSESLNQLFKVSAQAMAIRLLSLNLVC